MKDLLIANIGSYPRVGENKDHQRHRRALHHLQNKEISAHAFHDVEQSVIQEVAREQITAGLDEVTDGHVAWHDPISHFCRKLQGVKIQGLARYFDNNTYYRVPVFTGKPRKKGNSSLNDFSFTQSISNKPVRPVLTGPYTLARLSGSETKTFDRVQSRLSFFTELIEEEIDALKTKDAKIIQIDEPAFPLFPEDILLFRKAIEQLSEKVKPARFVLAFYFSSLSGLYDRLRTLPVDVLNFDLTIDGKKTFDALIQTPPKSAVGFGLINGRTTRMENLDPIINMLRTWEEKVDPALTYLTPSCGLDFLPRNEAFQKLKLLSKIKNEILTPAAG